MNIINKKTLNLILALSGWSSVVTAANIAYVPKVGPGMTPTVGTGKQWPDTRFITNGDCVTDMLTGLMWPKNGVLGFKATSTGALIAQPVYNNSESSLNKLVWADASLAVTKLNTAPKTLCGYSDWRLPNINELLSMVNFDSLSSANNSDPSAWLNSQGFTNFQSGAYWSSTIYNNTGIAWAVYFPLGINYNAPDSSEFNVWPVRGGK